MLQFSISFLREHVFPYMDDVVEDAEVDVLLGGGCLVLRLTGRGRPGQGIPPVDFLQGVRQFQGSALSR